MTLTSRGSVLSLSLSLLISFISSFFIFLFTIPHAAAYRLGTEGAFVQHSALEAIQA